MLYDLWKATNDAQYLSILIDVFAVINYNVLNDTDNMITAIGEETTESILKNIQFIRTEGYNVLNNMKDEQKKEDIKLKTILFMCEDIRSRITDIKPYIIKSI